MNNQINNDHGSSCIIVDLASVAFAASVTCVAIFAPAYWPLLFFWLLPFAFKEAQRQKRARLDKNEWSKLLNECTFGLKTKREDD